MASSLDPLQEEVAFLGLARQTIDSELRKGSSADAAVDRFSQRSLSEANSARAKALWGIREKPFSFAIEVHFEGKDQVFHVGIQHLDVGEDQIVDWRAPVAALRYTTAKNEERTVIYDDDEIVHVQVEGRRLGSGLKSSLPITETSARREDARDHEGSEQKRRVRTRAKSKLTAVTGSASPTLAQVGDGSGSEGLIDLVLANMVRARRSGMTEIVATIQKDQDKLMRLPVQVAIAIEGGPGTGKTIVGLHRLALVAYQERSLSTNGRLLMVGPSEQFVSYVQGVLPSLGERDIEQRSFASLCLQVLTNAQIDRVTTSLREAPEVAAIKASVVVFELMRRLVVGRLRFCDVHLRLGTESIFVDSESVRGRLKDAIVRIMSGEATLYSIREELAGWLRFCARLSVSLADRDARRQMKDRVQARIEFAKVRGEQHEVVEAKESSYDDSSVARAARDVAAKLIPDDDPVILLAQFHDVKSDAFSSSEPGFAPTENERLLRKLVLLHESPERVRRRRDGAISVSDLPLLHELKQVIGGRALERFGHVMVDEAQDFTPAMLHVIRRYVSGQQVTLLGDFNQRTRSESVRSWDEIQQRLQLGSLSVAALTKSYRVPKQTLDLAGKVLTAGERKRAPEGVRSGEDPVIIRVDADAVVGRVVRLVAKADEGQILVIADVEMRERLSLADERVVMVDPTEANGLEAGLVIVVEPGTWVADGDVLPHLHYVALTRTMGRLILVHSSELPEGLTAKQARKRSSSVSKRTPSKRSRAKSRGPVKSLLRRLRRLRN